MEEAGLLAWFLVDGCQQGNRKTSFALLSSKIIFIGCDVKHPVNRKSPSQLSSGVHKSESLFLQLWNTIHALWNGRKVTFFSSFHVCAWRTLLGLSSSPFLPKKMHVTSHLYDTFFTLCWTQIYEKVMEGKEQSKWKIMQDDMSSADDYSSFLTRAR